MSSVNLSRTNPRLQSKPITVSTSRLSTSRRRPPRKTTTLNPSLRENREPDVGFWRYIQRTLIEDAALTNILKSIQGPVIIIDRLNQIPAMGALFNFFNRKVGWNILRGNEYILSTALHFIGCHRGACRGQMGIQRLRLEDPLYFEIRQLQKGKEFLNIAMQAPKITFIEVFRNPSSSEELYKVELFPYIHNYIKVVSNGRFSKEIDDMLTVALFLRLRELGKEAYIQSCDKYRWMNKARLPNILKTEVKKNQLMPYFLSKEIMETPAIILMGFECAYDCTSQQEQPHDNACMLKNKTNFPAYI